MKKILAYVMLALIASLWGCSDMGDRDNPTDPGADNFDASLVPGDGNGGGDEPGDGGEGDDGKGSSSSNGISSNSSSSKGSSSSVTPKSSDSETSVSSGTMTDSRDGQTYKTVKIGDQVWMAQNLNYKSDNSYCYNDSAKYCSEYGRLYTWADAMESCPTGWHLPSKDEFVILANIAGGSSKAGKPLMAKDGWNSNGGGYDTYSFAALPGGARGEDGEYTFLGEQGSFWLASEEAFRFVANNLPIYISHNNRERGLSVRCLKDAGQSLSSSSQSGVNSSSSGKVSVELGTFTDERDEQTYKTVKIGDQVWMAQNLNFKTDSSFCYNDEEANCTKYGRHYKWAVAVGKSESECGYGNECSLPSGIIQGVCPSGWHLPSKTEWETLFTTVGGNSTAGKVLKSASGWNNSGNGTDAFEFTVLPAGGRYGSGNYSNEGKSAIFWSSTEFKDKDAYIVSLFYDGGAPYLSYAEKRYGYSVRCLMDTEQPSSSSSAISVLSPCKTADSDDCEYGSFTDERDGHTYKTVKIGDQEWMAENLNFDYNVGSAKSYCYDQSELNCDKYGRLYTWAAAMDSSAAFSNSAAGCGYLVDCSLSYPVRGVCPEGWILPDSTDMVKLIKAVGNYSVAGGTLRSVSQGGTDGYGFNFMMAGMRNNSGNYVNKDAIGYLWMSHPRGRYNADHILFEKVESARYYNNYRYNSFSVRCIQNTSAANASSSSKNGSSSSAESVSSSSETHPSETSSSSVASSEGASSSDEEVVDEYVYSNTQGWACLDSNEGEMKLGKVDNDVYFVCDAKEWREATTDEEISCRGSGYCKACTENGQGTFGEYEGNSFVCDGGTWRTPNCAETKLGSLCTANDGGVVPECESLGGFKIDYVCSQDPKASNKLVWHPVRSPFEYTLEYWNTKRNAYNTAAVEAGTHSDSMITDPRDGNVYRTIVMNGMRVFAENLRYADSAASKNLIGQTSCYNGESKNCEIGGRYYAWTAAMDLNGKWNSASASSLIGAQHRGICPEGWHIPDTTEWKTMFSAFGSAKPHQVMGYSGWTAATDVSGFTALPIDYLFETGVNIYNGFDYALFWSSSEDPVFDQSNTASYWWFNKDNTHLGGFEGVGDRGYKEYRLSVRCIQDYSVDP